MSSYVLNCPIRSAVRQSLTAGQHDLSIASTEALGNYRVRAGGEQEQLDRGFQRELPAEMSRLERVAVPELVKSLGKRADARGANARRDRSPRRPGPRRPRVVSGADPGRRARDGGRAIAGQSVL